MFMESIDANYYSIGMYITVCSYREIRLNIFFESGNSVNMEVFLCL